MQVLVVVQGADLDTARMILRKEGGTAIQHADPETDATDRA